MKSVKCIFAGAAAILIAVAMLSCASSGSSAPSEPVEGFSLNFDDPETGIAGWEVATGEFWDHKGTVTLSQDTETFGKGMLRMDVDFTADTRSEWSEPKIKYTFSDPKAIKGITRFTFDFIYNPENSSSGHFKSKVIGFNGSKSIVGAEVDAINGKEEIGDGYLKATVNFRIRGANGTMDNMLLSIAGYRTDYKGPVFFDNMRWE